MSTGSLGAVVGKCEEGLSPLSLRIFWIIELQFLVGCWVERWSSERLSSEPKSGDVIAQVEGDRGYSSAPVADASEVSF